MFDGFSGSIISLMNTLELLKEQCSRYVNGECDSIRCLLRGGYRGGAPADNSLATCLIHEAAKAMNWQPIETAPKDGTSILAWRRDWKEGPRFVQWRLNRRTCTTFWNDPVENDDYENEENPPTHWFELPETP